MQGRGVLDSWLHLKNQPYTDDEDKHPLPEASHLSVPRNQELCEETNDSKADRSGRRGGKS
ncbi:unnamed protein product, partial [Ascophyllum nodosum]